MEIQFPGSLLAPKLHSWLPGSVSWLQEAMSSKLKFWELALKFRELANHFPGSLLDPGKSLG